MSTDKSDPPTKTDLEEAFPRIAELEQQLREADIDLDDFPEKEGTTRRDLLKAAGVAGTAGLVGGAGVNAATQGAQAGTQSTGSVGAAGDPVDVVAEDIYGPGGQGSGDAVGFEAVTTDKQAVGAFTDHELGRYQQQDALEAMAGAQAVTGAGTTGTSAALTGVSRTAITSETDASGAASSGSGTRDDPYVINKQEWDNSEGSASTAGFYWDDPDATYHIKLVDFKIYNYSNAQLYVDAGPEASLLAENGVIYTGTGSGNLVDLYGGTLRLHNIDFDGSAGHVISARGGRLHLQDVEHSGTQSNFGTSLGFAFCVYAAGVREVTGDNITATNSSLNRFVQVDGGPVSFDFSNIDLRNFAAEAINHTNNSDTHRIREFRLNHFHIQNTGQEGINLRYADQVRIADGNVFDTADGTRGIIIRESRDIVVERCRFSDANGTGGAGNELCEVAGNCKSVVFRDLWAESASEDAFETVHSENVSIKNVGGVNVSGQIVDIFGTGSEGETIIEDVCGDGHEGILITDADNVTIRGTIATRTDHPAIKLEQRNAGANVSPDDCFIACQLPPASDSNTTGNFTGTTKASGRIGLVGDIGPNNLVTIFANGAIQRKVNVENL